MERIGENRMEKCAKCGCENDLTHRYCVGCGSDLSNNGEKIKAKNKAKAGMACGIVSIFFLGFILGIIAIILSVQGKKQLEKHNESSHEGDAGLTTGIIGLVVWLIILLITIIVIIVTITSRYSYPFWGSGTKEDPYMIMTKEDLIELAEQVNSNNNYSRNKYFTLGADIDLEGMEWMPIGSRDNQERKAFQGNFDGAGYKVSNFKITKSEQYVGFFGAVSNATIKNLEVSDFVFDLDSEYETYVGGIVGYGYIDEEYKILNCIAKGDISISSKHAVYAGGLGGYLEISNPNYSISNCYAAVNVSADSYGVVYAGRSEEHTSELQSLTNLVCRLLLEIGRASCRERV